MPKYTNPSGYSIEVVKSKDWASDGFTAVRGDGVRVNGSFGTSHNVNDNSKIQLNFIASLKIQNSNSTRYWENIGQMFKYIEVSGIIYEFLFPEPVKDTSKIDEAIKKLEEYKKNLLDNSK